MGGRGASSSSNTSRAMLQRKITDINANDNTRVIMQNSEGGNLFNTKITQINSEKYVDDLRRPAKSVEYNEKDNTIIIKLKKQRSRNIPF